MDRELIGWAGVHPSSEFVRELVGDDQRELKSRSGDEHESVSKSRVFSSSTGYLTVTFTSDGFR